MRLGAGLALLSLLPAIAGTARTVAGEAGPSGELVVQDVEFAHRADRLAGVLYRPPGPGPHAAIVMLFGSGPVDRQYGGVGPALGNHFARAGFACLAWDRPGVGGSTGDYRAHTLPDRADEALAAVRFLRSRPDIRRETVGIWGHSQGGMVAPIAASQSDKISFVIEVGGWQGPAWQQDAVRVEAELRAAGFAAPDITRATQFARARMELIRGTGPFEALERAQNDVKSLPWFRAVKLCDRALFESSRHVVGYDSTPSWSHVRCPVLAIYGDKDLSSGPPERLVAIIQDGCQRAGNADVTIKVFVDADHSLRPTRPAAPGAPEPPGDRHPARGSEPTFVTGYLETMTDWLVQRFGRSDDRH